MLEILRVSLPGEVWALADVTKEDSSEFLVRHEKLDLRIYISSSNSLLPHEETIPSRVSQLEVSFRLDGREQGLTSNLDIDIISHAIKLQRDLQGNGQTWRSMEPEMDRCQSLDALR